ncbi:autotransporter adhesin [Pasteurella multocida]|nr:autotransporter adhesin [Pasteurella multocida]
MNKVYKVIWNHSLNTFVVVSELARGYAKSSSSSNSSTSKLSKVFKLNLLGLLLAISLPSQAYIAIGSAENNYLNSNGADAKPLNPGVDGGTYPLDYKNPGNKSYDNKDISIGGNNYSPKTSSGIAIGKYSSAIASRADRRSNGIAIGDYSKATGGLSMALGSFSLAGNVGSIALGTASRADGFNALSMMRQSAAIGDYSTAIGSVSWANGTASFALGASATAFGDQSIAIGSVSPTTSASASNSKKTKYDGLNRTQTNGNNSIAMGSAARTNGENSFAIGSGAETGEFIEKRDTYLEDMVREADVNKKAKGAMAFGVNAKAKEAKAIAFGEEAKALKENAIAFGALANATESSSMAFGSKANALKQNAMAFGASAQASQQNAMAFGASAQASQQNAMAFGASAQATQQNAMAFGTNAKATVTKAIAIGSYANATQSSAVAIGSEANAIQSNATAIGTTSKASQANSTALGFGAQATHQDSVALGANSKTATKVATNSQNINGISHNFAGGNPIGTVSVGDTNKERTITNVGAGRISSTSTDAINGSQLHAVITEVNKGWNITTAADAGEVSGTNKPANVKLGDTVTVKAGKNIKITQADKNITVATKDNVTFKKVDAETLNVTGDTTVKNLTATGDTKVKNFTVDPSSNINMGNNRIMNVGDPTEATDAVNKKYVDNVEFNYKGDSGTGKNKLSTQTAFKGTANEIVTAATNGSVTFSLAKEVKDSLVLAKSAVQNFTVGAGATEKITVDKDQRHFDIKGTNDYVTTKVDERNITIGLGNKAKNAIDKVTTREITVTAGNTRANSFTIADGGDIKVIAKPSNEPNIIEVAADTVNKAITVGINKTNFDNAVTNNPQVQANKNKLTELEPKVNENKQKITALDTKVTENKNEINNLKPQVTANKTEIDKLKPQVENNKTEIDTLKPQVEKNKTEIDNLKPQVADNKTEIDKLKPKVEKNTNDLNTLNTTVQAGWELTINDNEKVKDVTPTDRKANFKAGDNIVISNDKGSVKIATSLTPKFTNATFGDNGDKTVINKDGITITNTNPDKSVSLTDNGLDNGGHRIQNIANGTSPNDAVNMSQLDAVKATANAGWKLQVNKESASESTVTPNATVSLNNDDGNIQITKTKNDNNVTFALNTNLVLGKEDPTGKDGALTVKGKDGSSVVLNGKDGSIGLTGTASADGSKPQTTIKVTKGQPDVNNTGNKTRITYTNDNNGGVEEVATLNDGLKFKGDNDPIIKKKLNEQLEIIGGANKDKLSSNNIGVNENNGKLEIKLSKELSDLVSAEFGTGNDKTAINKDGITITNGDKNVSLTENGLNNGGNKISNIANGVDDSDAVNMSQLNAVNATANAGWTLFANNTEATKSVIKPNSTVSLNNKDGNIQITKTANDGNVTFALNTDLTLGKDGTTGKDGSLTVKGKDGSSVALNGKDGSIGLAGPAGKPSTTIKVIEGKGGVGDADTVKKNRITYTNGAGNSEEVATLNDGLKFKGDTGTEIVKKLNETLTIKGNMATTDEVTDKNLRVDNDNGNLILKMAKSLKDLANATFGTDGDKTSIDKDGITITNNGNTISLTDNGLNNGNKQITNVASGLGNTKLSDIPDNDTKLNNAANVGDLKNAITDVVSGGFGLKDDKDQEIKQNLGTSIKVQGDGSITTKVVDKNGNKALEVGLTNNVTVGDTTQPGNVTIKGKNGTDGITLNGENGTIGLKGKDGVSTNITVANGPNTLDGQPNTNTTPRITYTNNGRTEHVATTNDGLIFGANEGVEHKAKLNTKVDIKGAGVNSDWNKFDSGTNLMTKVDTASHLITIALAKDLKDLTSATFKDNLNPTATSVLNGNGLTITPAEQGKKPVKLTDSGLDNGDNQITNLASGLGDNTKLGEINVGDSKLKNAANIGDLKNAIDNLTKADTNGGFGLKDEKNKEIKQNLGTTIQVKGDGSITTEVIDENNNKALKISLTNNVAVGSANQPGSVTIKGKNGTDAITLNGQDGTIGLKGKDGVNTNISVANGPNTLDGQPNTNITPRITYTNNGQTEHVATTNDGLIFGANTGNEHKAKLNAKVHVKGADNNVDWGLFDQGKNLMTNMDNGTIRIGLAKDLTALNSATFTETTNPAAKSVVNGKGLTITPADNNKQTVSLTDAGLNNGGNKITNVGSGLGTQSLENASGDTLTNAVNVQDLKNAITKTVGESGWNLKTNGDTSTKIGHNDTVQFINGGNIEITRTEGSKDITISTKKDINVNSLKAGKKGNDGVDGNLTTEGKDGSSVALNGKDGSISVSNKGQDGASANITVKQGRPDVNGQPNTKKTRITYQPTDQNGAPQGDVEEVATLKDGLKFKGDKGTEIVKQLNETLTIKGNIADTVDVTDKNLRVDSDGTDLILKMAKSLQDLKDATFGTDTDKSVLNKDGLTITEAGKTVSLTQDGLNNGGNQIKNVSSGLSNGKTLSTLQDGDEDLKNAANISDLKNAVNNLTKASDLGGFGLTDQYGAVIKQDLGKSIKIKGDESIVTKVVSIGNNNEKALQVGLNKDITVGDDANPGSVTIKGNNDKDAIALNGQDGTIKLKDSNGVDRVSLNGNDGSIGLTGKDGVNGNLTFAKGASHVDGKNGVAETPRISYKSNNGTPEFVATLNDGLKFGANTGTVHNAKLNSQIDVKGDANNKDWTQFDAGKNIMTSINGGTITVGLAKALTDLESVTFNKDKNGGTPTATTKIDSNGLTITPTGNNVPDKTVSLTDKGLNNGGNTITNIASGLTKADGSKSELKDATGDVLNNAANIGDLKSALTNLTDNGFGLKDQDGKEFKHKLGETAQIKGDGSVVTKVVTNDDSSKALQIGLNKDITVGNAKDPGSVTVKGSNDKDSIKLDGTAGKITVKKDDGKDAVSLNKDGTIGIDGADGASASLTMKKGPADLEGKNANEQNPRLTYTPNGSKTPEFVATLNDGLKFGANTGTVRNAKLNSQIDVKGDVKNTDWNKFDAGKNIMTNINDGTITVGLAKALTDLESITFNKNTNGNPTATAKIDSNGLTITPNGNNVLDKTVSLTDKGLNNGGNKITNIAAGDVSENSKDAVNGSQLYEVKETANAGWNLSVNEDKANNSSNVKPKQTVELNNSDGNIVITKTEDNGKHKVDFKLGDTLTVGPKDATGKPTEGAVVIGKDGRDGKNNENTIALVGKDGKDAVAIKGKDGVGTIGLTGAAGKDGTKTSAELSIAEGAKGLDGNDRQNSENKTRIVYKKPDGKSEEIATLNDGLIFAGNDGTLINRKLNSQLNILGGITEKTDLTDKNKVSSDNLGVRWKSEDSLEIVMKERPTFSGLVLNGKDGQPANIKFEDKNGVPGMSLEGTTKDGDPALTLKNKDGQDGVTFTNDGRITNVADGKDGKDAVNMNQLNKAKEDLVNKGFGIKAQDGNAVNKSLGDTVEIVGADSNISTKVEDGKVKIALAKTIDLGDDGSITAGKTVLNKDGVKVGDKVALTKDGLKVGDKVNITEAGVKVGDVNITEAGIDAGSKKVTNVADGDISANSTDAVNGSQLFKEAAKAKTEVEAGDNIDVSLKEGTSGQKIYTVATKKDVLFDNVKVGDIAINKDDGINAGDKKITNVANGEIGKGSKDAVNGDQLFTEAAKAKSEVKAGTNVASVTTGTGDKGQTIYTVNADGASVSAGSDKVTVTKGTKDANNVTDYKVDLAQATKDDIAKGVDAKAQVDKGINFAGDDGKSTNYKLGDTITISGDSNLTTETTDKGVTVKLNKDINLNSVSANTFKAGGVTISADSGINAGGKQITHVASGLVDKNGNKIHIRNAAGDTLNNAVNVGDLKTVAGDIYNNIDTTNKRVDKLDKRVRGIGANSAAAASLPQVYIPGKSMVAASAGGYGGEAAVALGYSRASDNGKVILKLTGTANSAGHYSGGVGVGYQW